MKLEAGLSLAKAALSSSPIFTGPTVEFTATSGCFEAVTVGLAFSGGAVRGRSVGMGVDMVLEGRWVDDTLCVAVSLGRDEFEGFFQFAGVIGDSLEGSLGPTGGPKTPATFTQVRTLHMLS